MSEIKERFAYSDYHVKVLARSKIDRSRAVEVSSGFKCPHCRKHHPEMHGGDVVVCACGLKMEKVGGFLECTLKTKEK